MTITELINLFRLQTQDDELPGSGDDSLSLFKNDEIIEYINESQQEFARQTGIYKVGRNETIRVSANKPWVQIDPEILAIKRAFLDNKKIDLLTHRDLEQVIDWEEKTGTPTALVIDLELEYLRAYPIPTTATVFTLAVEKLPTPVTEIDDPLDIPKKYHRKLLHYALFLAYSKHDADSFDPQAADKQLALHEKALDDARREIGIRFKKPRTVKYGGI